MVMPHDRAAPVRFDAAAAPSRHSPEGNDSGPIALREVTTRRRLGGVKTRPSSSPHGDPSAAVPAVQQVVLVVLPIPGRFAPAAENSYRKAVMAMVQGDDVGALASFEAVVARDPTILSAHLLAATRPSIAAAAAIRHLEAIVESRHAMPDRFQAKYLAAGFAHLSVRLTDNLTVALPVDSFGATVLLAQLYQEAGRIKDAMRLVKRLHEANPTDPAIVLSLADVLLADNDLEGVVAVTDRIDNQDDKSVAMLHIRSVALFGLGRGDEALATFRVALAKTQRDPALLMAVRYDRALVLRRLGKKAAARRDLQRLAALDGGYRDVGELLTPATRPLFVRRASR
jgi:tetratricopeptide (TPR) repeat protein